MDSTAELTKLMAVCRQQFEQMYGYPAEKIFFAPGRLNIIGEHIDYNGGLVFPCAIGLGTVAAVGRSSIKDNSAVLRLYSHNFPEMAPQVFSCTKFTYRPEQKWCNYPLGMVQVLQQEGMVLKENLDIVIFGNLPTGGSGLSSSASLEVLVGYILQNYHDFPLSRRDLAVLAQKAENEFCGLNCGIMDQFIIAVAEAHKACLLDCASLNYEPVPLDLAGHAFLIANTKVPRKLQESKYNERRSECEEALAILQGASSDFAMKENLCALTEVELPVAFRILARESEILARRARHVISENYRTYQAAEAMRRGDWEKLAGLLRASHASLREDYEVSGAHLDYLVSLLEQEEDVLGARMTGAGFGGCAIALVREKDLESLAQLQRRVATVYNQQFGWEPEFYLSDAVAGVHELNQTII